MRTLSWFGRRMRVWECCRFDTKHEDRANRNPRGRPWGFSRSFENGNSAAGDAYQCFCHQNTCGCFDRRSRLIRPSRNRTVNDCGESDRAAAGLHHHPSSWGPLGWVEAPLRRLSVTCGRTHAHKIGAWRVAPPVTGVVRGKKRPHRSDSYTGTLIGSPRHCAPKRGHHRRGSGRWNGNGGH